MWGKVWSDDDVAELRRYLGAGLGYEAIAIKMGRPAGGVRTKIKRISGNVVKRRTPWTKAECDKLVELKEKYSLTWDEIARRLNKPSGTVYSKYVYINQQAALDARREQGERPPSAEVIVEWTRRLMLAPRDLTAAFCGDPLPGYSALDRKRQGVEA